LTAPKKEQEGEEAERGASSENGGYWSDGAYMAKANTSTTISATRLLQTQIQYYDTLLAQFRLLQATLRCTPPLHTVQNLPKSRPISFPSETRKAALQWTEHILESEPTMVQVACMDMDSVWELVKLLNSMLSKGQAKAHTLGPWIWAALGKCPDLGLMVSDEVSELRSLARTAASILDGELGAAEQLEDDPDAQALRSEGQGEILMSSKEFGGLHNSSAIVLDMVVTVVGEIYGQRDLLEQRMIWTSPEG
jgi:hypothetical protein